MDVAIVLLASLWILTVFEPQWFLAAHGAAVFLKAPVIFFGGLMVVLAFRTFFKGWGHRWTWYPPLLMLVLVAVVMVPFAPNPRIAFDATEFMCLGWFLLAATTALVDSAPRAELLVKTYAFQFLLWGLLGASTGIVSWHSVLSNPDGFGSFMVIGGGLCALLAFSTRNKWERRLLVLTVGLAAIGVVASFARGAALAAALIAGLVWLRSPRKGLVVAIVVVCAVAVVATATMLYGEKYWAELATIAQGTEEATGEDRWEMWTAGLVTFAHHPILGTGAKNWGVWAADFFKPGQLGGDYAVNPRMLYDKSLHNSYVQVAAEHGIMGAIALVWMILDFWRRNMQLRTAAAVERWHRLGGRLHLKWMAFALEAAFIAWLASASLYSHNGNNWLYVILALNLTVHRVVAERPRRSAPMAHRRARYRPMVQAGHGPLAGSSTSLPRAIGQHGEGIRPALEVRGRTD
jgi:O-antigen ligase